MESLSSRSGRRSKPLSPPASPTVTTGLAPPSKGLSDFFSAPLTPDATPPPSLPTSPPLSPELRKVRLRKTSGKKLKAASEVEEVVADEVEDPASPILPKVRLAFPTIMSDEEEEDGWGSKRYTTVSGGSEGKGRLEVPVAVRPRTWSQKTTTTRRTEHRSVRYSMPSFEHLQDDTGSSSASTPPNYSPRVSLPSSQSTPYLSSPSSPSSYSRRPTTSTSSASASYARTTKTSLPSRRSSNSFSGSNTATRFDSPYRSGSPSSASSFPRPSRPRAYDAQYDFRAPAAVPPPKSPRASAGIDSLPFIKPFINVFVLLLISTIACASISAVLVTGFSLTFYDDCGKRVRLIRDGIGEGQKRVQDGIDGFRAGMVRMLGASKGAFGLAGWAAGVGAKRLTNGRERVSFAKTSRHGEEGGQDGGEGYLGPTFKNYSRGRSRSRRRKSCSPSVGPPRFDAAREVPASTSTTTTGNPDEGAGAWQSDEDAMPYDVPPSTPRRSPSPSSSRRQLPPRPPLRILVPSIILALLYTLGKVAWGVWMGQPWRSSPPKRSQDQQAEE